MQASISFKQVFLKHMLLGLRSTGLSSKTMSFEERKDTIKLLANAAMAFARGGRNWSRALIGDLCKQEKKKALVSSIMGKDFERLTKPCYPTWKVTRSKKILRRSFESCSRMRRSLHPPCNGVPASDLARNLVKKRTQVLRSLIPGGQSLDGFLLLDEALDYVISLRSQVNLMRCLAEALGATNLKYQSDRCSLQAREASCVGK